MDNWPRIPRNQSSSTPSRSGGASLPPSGTVVMANVEEDLGEGMYALRWAGNRIAVSSRVKLEPGQSLILKSEVSAEGKPTLVVQGPALPQGGRTTGRFLYGPPEHGAATGQSEQGGRQAVAAAAPERGGGADMPAAGSTGATSTPSASASAAGGSGSSVRGEGALVGAILEPLPEFATRADALLREAAKEIATLKPANATTGDAATGDAAIPETIPGAGGEGKGQPPAPSGEKPPAVSGEKPSAPAPSVPSDASASGTAAAKPSAPATTSPAVPVPAPLPGTSGEKPSAPAPSVPSDASGTVAAKPSAPATTSPAVPVPAPLPGTSGEKPAAPAPSVPSDASASGTVAAKPSVPATSSPAVPVPAPLPGTSGEKPAVPSPTPEKKPPDAQPVPPQTDSGSEGKRPVPSQTIRPEVLLKEALTQLLKAADLPLSAAASGGASLGIGGKMPEAVAEKAAAILLRGVGLSPDAATLEAARALLENGAAIERQTVLALVALAAGAEEGERAAILKAAARLAARDVPLATPLVSGLAEVLRRGDGVGVLLDRAVGSLVPGTAPAEIRPLLQTASEMLSLLRVDLDQPDAAPALARYLSSFGREALGKSLALVETSAQTLLETHPVLPKIDAAMTAILIASGVTDAEATAPAHSQPVPGMREQAGGQTATPAAPAAPGSTGGTPSAPATAAATTAAAAAAATATAGSSVQTTPPLGSAAAAVAGPADTEDAAQQPAQQSTEQPAEQPAEQPRPAAANPHSPINAYLRSPRAFPGLASLNLPPMPRVVTLSSAGSDAGVGQAAGTGQSAGTGQAAGMGQLDGLKQGEAPDGAPSSPLVTGEAVAGKPVLPGAASPAPGGAAIQPDANSLPLPGAAPAPETTPAPDGKTLPPGSELPLGGRTPPDSAAETLGKQGKPEAPVPGTAEGNRRPDGEAREQAQSRLLPPDAREAGSSLLRRVDSLLFQTPGLNRPEVELLRPGGFFDRFFGISSGDAASGAGGGKTAAEAETLARDLLSDDSERREQALRELPRREQAVLRETAARLSRMEREILRAEPTLSRLADAASSLRDLGRQLLAVKAENLAGQERDPAVMLAETPFKLADQSGEGRMQMFYRKSAKKTDGWTSRVILDLNTTGMGPVLGDMRFFGGDMILNLFVEKQETADFLAVSAEGLTEALLAKGFRLKSRFLVLPPPPPPPELRAGRPVLAGEGESPSPEGAAATVPLARPGRGTLDVKG